MSASRGASAAVMAALLALASGCTADADADADVAEGGDESALIGGKLAEPGQFPATVLLRSGCTAAKVGPRVLLTAAHCLYDPMAASLATGFRAGATLELTRDPAAGFRQAVVAETIIHEAWLSACERTFCAASAVTAKIDAPDVGVIILEGELDGVAVAAVDDDRLDRGDRVTVLGYGCEAGVLVPDDRMTARLSYAETRITSASRADHEGSFVAEGDLAQVDTLYAMTLGPAAAKAASGLCPGDSGGPVYRRRGSSLVVVGVNSNYTLLEGDAAGLPVTNWHTRLDDGSRHRVGSFVRAAIEGAAIARAAE